MLKIIKYEWMSRWKFFLGGFALLILFHFYIVTKTTKNVSFKIFASGIFIIIFVAGIVLMVDHIGRMYRSLFKETGYLLFTTPLSGYEVLGGKILSVVLECLGITLFSGILMFIDYKIVVSKFPEFQIPDNIPNEFIFMVSKVFIGCLLGYIILLLMVYLSVTLTKSIFSSFKYGKLLSFICFIIIAKIVGKLVDLVGSAMEYSTFINVSNGSAVDYISNVYFIMNICIIGLLFMSTGYLLDRKINL